MSALGHKQPLNTAKILTSEWLVLGRSGHSPLRILEAAGGCFRPEAVVEIEPSSLVVATEYNITVLLDDLGNLVRQLEFSVVFTALHRHNDLLGGAEILRACRLKPVLVGTHK
jgi:hypothetical protein